MSGDVVRIAPNELSFSHPDSIKDIYGQVNINHPKFFPKSRTFYQQTDVGRSVGTEVDPVIHQKIRKLLAPGFSASALKRQEDVVLHYIDLLVEQVKIHGSNPSGMDMIDWFTWLAFDVVVDLAFGDSFRSVENGESPTVRISPSTSELTPHARRLLQRVARDAGQQRLPGGPGFRDPPPLLALPAGCQILSHQ